MQHHLESFLADAAAADPDGEGVPNWVADDFRAYLRCGILAHGFARIRCDACAAEHLVAFSCKGRGACPSCNARRMVEVAAHLIDHVLPPCRCASGCSPCRSGSAPSCPTTRASPATCSAFCCAPYAPRFAAPAPAPRRRTAMWTATNANG
ncbi:MAG: transposase zinc-binding domain-containing protein [Gemmatimonadetes bacterium]|nr:transposase zinc-binding domain-containing protein [Gemmatimonadota bacterium]